MAKKWTDFTRREKVIGVLVAIFAVISISGISSAIGGGGSTSTPVPVSPTPKQVIHITTYKDVEETEPIAFTKETKNDSSIASGTSKVTTPGVNGVKTKTYRVTLLDNVETTRELKGEAMTTAPITEVTSIGTYVAPAKKTSQGSGSCDPNYSGACVPIASDADCSGGSGNGPAYVVGPVTVIGSDIYDLDRDGNKIGCE